MPETTTTTTTTTAPVENKSTMRRFTETLREAAGDQWNRVITHKFTTEIAAGTIDREVLKRYLIQDHRFLDAFVVLLASMISRARSLEDRIPGCQFLAIITGKENTYFERSFEALGVVVANSNSNVPNATCTDNFCGLMHDVAVNGTLGEMLSVLVVCEWSYLSWGQRVVESTKREHFFMYEWVDLHSGEFFEGVIAYLRGLLDKEGELMDDQGREKCKNRFLQAVQYEEDFFEFAYAG